MLPTSLEKTSQQMVEAIFALDLEPIKFKMMDKEEGYGWTRDEADRYELQYKRYLALLAKFPKETIAPSKTVDKFWHGHILDTMKYAQDCNHVFGYFLHHFPYFGMRGEQDAANLASAAVNMRRLYEQEFGVAEQDAVAYCGVAAANPSYCGATSDKVAAYCGVIDVSYCGAATGKATKRDESAAYCGTADVSYCGAVSGKPAAKAGEATAYCGVKNVNYREVTAAAAASANA